MNTTSLAPLAFPLLVAAVAAQAPPHLVGMTRTTPALRHQATNCQIHSQCQLAGMPPANNLPFVGGTAWDPRRSGAWVTNGQVLAKYDDDCTLQCGPMPIPSLSSVSSYITGLEVIDLHNQIWMIDNHGGLHFYSNTCPPVHQGGCSTVLVPTPAPVMQVTTGLAVDEGIGLVFVSYPDLTAGTTRIAVNDLSNPCVQFDMFHVPPCPTNFGPVIGLACDWGKLMLYATDGQSVVSMNYAWNGTNVTLVSWSCCAGTIAVLERMVGLAMRPGRAGSLGPSCANGSCPPCPMNHSLANDPVLGNLDFRLRVDGVFGSSFSFCMIGDGPCNALSPGVPPLCGPIYTDPFLGYLGPNLVNSPAICGGSTTFHLPLPLTPSLVGNVYSSQIFELCITGAGLGISLSNCLSWELLGI
ncbi:MAG TPA: hypothetical protein VF384_11955 [Planctomycetota bacterium]